MDESAHDALSAISTSRNAAADRFLTPWWYHPILGLLAAGFVLIYSLGNLLVIIAGGLLYVLGIGILIGAYRRKTGVWISGLQAGKANRWAYALMALFGVCMVGAMVAARLASAHWVAWLAAAVLFAGAIFTGYRFDATLRAQLRQEL